MVKAVIIVMSVHLSTLLMVSSDALSTMVSPEWRLNLGFGAREKRPFPLNRSAPSIVTRGQACFSLRFVNNIPAGRAKRKESPILEWRCIENK